MSSEEYISYKGVLFPSMDYSVENLDRMENEFQFLDDDIINVTYPKSVTYGSWFDHVKGWMELQGRPNFFFVTYEELQQDLRGCVEKICRFLGKELTSQQIDSVVEYASFKKMKENKMSNFTQLDESMGDFKKGNFMRKGICGDWKNHLTVAQNEHFDRVYRENMRDMNTSFLCRASVWPAAN